MTDSSPIKPFSLTGPQYSAGYFGRVRTFYDTTDPRTLFLTSEQISKSKSLLESFKNGNLPAGTTDADLWAARRIVDACVHPDTGETITPLFRFSAFAPVNIFICSVMLSPVTIASVPANIGIHWFNQSYNAAVNYNNRNASSPIPTSLLMQGYAGAVAASLTIGLGATAVTKKLGANMSPKTATIVRATLPFLAVAAAGCANLLLMRQTELKEGVTVMDDEGTVYGKSIVAAKQGLTKCCAARVLWNIPIMVVPPIVMYNICTSFPSLNAQPRVKMALEVLTVSACLFAGIPPSLAAFPQRDSLPVSKMESNFHNLKDRNGKPVQTLWFNKGL